MINTEQLSIKARYGSAVVFQEAGTVYAVRDEDTGLIDSGTDAGAVIQSAVDYTGNVVVAGSQDPYLVLTTISLGDTDVLMREGVESTEIKQADGANVTNIIKYSDQTGSEFFAGIFDLLVHGNKGNNTSGTGVSSHKGTERTTTRMLLYGMGHDHILRR